MDWEWASPKRRRKNNIQSIVARVQSKKCDALWTGVVLHGYLRYFLVFRFGSFTFFNLQCRTSNSIVKKKIMRVVNM